MMDEQIELEPCPFCGGEVEIHELQYFGWITCKRCTAKFESGLHAKGKALAAAWNRRERETALNKTLDDVAMALEADGVDASHLAHVASGRMNGLAMATDRARLLAQALLNTWPFAAVDETMPDVMELARSILAGDPAPKETD